MNTKSILNGILEEISLTEKEEKDLNKLAKAFVSKIKKAGAKAYIGGSLAKGTLVKKKEQDVDVFVVFKVEKEVKKLAGILKKAKFEFEVIHGSRDYYHIKQGEVMFEIIPVVEVKKIEEANNVTDVSLTHVKYVTRKIKENPALANEIVLAKAFCAANNVYGAESYIGGFSGYSLEVLVSHFGSFVKFLRGISKKQIIDPEKSFKNAGEIMRELNASKLIGPVILVDPTYKYRNVCAGLHDEAFAKFLKVAKDFLKKPSKKFFEKKEFNLEKFKRYSKARKAELLEFNLFTDRQEGDIAGTKMKKMLRLISDELLRKQQEVLKTEFVYSGGKNAKGYIILRFNNRIKFRGPPIFMKEQAKNFRKEHKRTFIEKKHVCAYEKFDSLKFFRDMRKVGKEVGANFRLSK